MNCTKCSGPIRRGDRYVCIAGHIEREEPRGVITVEDAEVLAAYHTQCAAGQRCQVVIAP